MLDNKVVLVGYSGHGFVVADAALSLGMNLVYYTEIERQAVNPFELEYLGNESDASFNNWNTDYLYILGIGDNNVRKKISDRIILHGCKIPNVIHSSVSIGAKLAIGYGNFIARNVSINPLVEIGNNCIINTGSIIEHECRIGNIVHIAPGAVLAGNVSVDDGAFVGANSVIKQGVRIGKNAVIGAGSVILCDVADGQKIVGNPGRFI